MDKLTNMARQLKRISGKRHSHEPLITVEISRGRLLHNLNEFRKVAPGGRVAPVLKSNAYGHGLFEVAEILEKDAQGMAGPIPFFAVDSYFEAAALRARGMKTPILIIGYTRPETILTSRLKNVAFTVTALDTLRSLEKITYKKNKIKLHLKVDTGMRRQGVLPSEIPEALNFFKNNSCLELEGLMTHLCDADNSDTSFTEEQIVQWNTIARRIKADFPSIKFIHASATDGHRFAEKIEANASRLGIGLYGLSDDTQFCQKMNLKPVLSMKTIITGIKKLKARETTGYGNTFKAQKDMTIATIPVGYFEGLNRKLSNNGSVIVIGRQGNVVCPIIGRVSMNTATIEIPSAAPAVKNESISIGSKVVAVSDKMNDENSIASIAKKSGTISYEIAVHIPAHLKRVIV